MFTKVFAAALFTLGIKSAQAGLDAELKLCLGLDCGFCVTEEVPFNSCLNVFDFAGIMLRCTDDGEEIDVDLMSSSDCSGSLSSKSDFPSTSATISTIKELTLASTWIGATTFRANRWCSRSSRS